MWKRLRNNNPVARSFIFDNSSAQKYTPRNSVQGKKSPRKSLIFKRNPNKSQSSIIQTLKTDRLDLLLNSKKDATSIIDSGESNNQDRINFGSQILAEKQCNEQIEYKKIAPQTKRILRKQSLLNNPKPSQKSVKYCFFQTSSINPSSEITEKQVQNGDKTVIQQLSMISVCDDKNGYQGCEAKKQMERMKEKMQFLANQYLQEVRELQKAKLKFLHYRKASKR